MVTLDGVTASVKAEAGLSMVATAEDDALWYVSPL
jgi:hypothetical protein